MLVQGFSVAQVFLSFASAKKLKVPKAQTLNQSYCWEIFCSEVQISRENKCVFEEILTNLWKNKDFYKSQAQTFSKTQV